MTVSDKLISALNRTLDIAGTKIKIQYYTQTVGSVWDDEITYAQSGTDYWVSGIVFPVRGIKGSTEAVLLEQGKLINSDKRVYVQGDVQFNGSLFDTIVQIGSPNGDLFSTITDGAEMWETNGTPVYKKQYVRRMTGSTL